MKQLLVLSFLILMSPTFAMAGCFESGKTMQNIGQIKNILSCFEQKIEGLEQKNKTLQKQIREGGGGSITVNAVKGLPEPKVSASTVSATLKLALDLLECKRRVRVATCYFQMTNSGPDEDFYINEDSRAFDEFGQEYKSGVVDVGNDSADIQEVANIEKHLISGLPARISITFNDVPKKSTQFAAIDIKVNGEKLKIRNVVIFD